MNETPEAGKAAPQPPQGPQGPQGGGTMKPGDEAPPGTPGTGENLCRNCGGSGRIDGAPCPECNGTGTVTTAIGGA